MYTVNEYCRRTFGEKMYKISLDAGMTCPNRDGTLSDRGCIFCSRGGSGDFAPDSSMSIEDQIEEAKKRVGKKFRGNKYIAYFQAFTNTYGPVKELRRLYMSVIMRPDIGVLSIATRPDCLGNDILELLNDLNKIKPVWVELGLQTTKKESVRYIRRGYENRVYFEAVEKLRAIGVHVITHVILGLPGESHEDMIETVRAVVKSKSHGIKLQLLHILRETDLAADFEKGLFKALSLEEYTEILKKCLKEIPEDMVIHRITGDGPKSLLIAPKWSADKKRVLNTLNKALK